MYGDLHKLPLKQYQKINGKGKNKKLKSFEQSKILLLKKSGNTLQSLILKKVKILKSLKVKDLHLLSEMGAVR
jgi:hypothetical protein